MREEKHEEDVPSLDDSSEDSLSFSDARSWHSPLNRFDSNDDLPDDRSTFSDVIDLEMGACQNQPRTSVSEYSNVDLGNAEDGCAVNGGACEMKVKLAKVERDCRICHLSLDSVDHESGVPIELGCSCKDDLAAAHKQCAEAWFKIKGNKTCEICGSTAHNVVGVDNTEFMEQWNGASTAANPQPPSDRRRFLREHPFLNFILACLVFAFVISWLFHFNAPS